MKKLINMKMAVSKGW